MRYLFSPRFSLELATQNMYAGFVCTGVFLSWYAWYQILGIRSQLLCECKMGLTFIGKKIPFYCIRFPPRALYALLGAERMYEFSYQQQQQ